MPFTGVMTKAVSHRPLMLVLRTHKMFYNFSGIPRDVVEAPLEDLFGSPLCLSFFMLLGVLSHHSVETGLSKVTHDFLSWFSVLL